MAAGRARVGCSGWQYRDWRGLVYPAELRQRDWFAWYAAHFDTVELNTTFYRMPTLETVAKWTAAAPPDFVYATKLGAFGSHRMKLRDAASWLPNHVERIRALGAAAGPTLVQLPPRWRRNVERLDEFLTAAPRDLRWAVELREPSWLHDDVFATLAQHGAALCLHDLLPRHPWVCTTDWTYMRFHGPDALNAKYQGRYGASRLYKPARQLAAWLTAGIDVYAYFNNDYEGHAVADAETLRTELGTAELGTAMKRGHAEKGPNTMATRKQTEAAKRNIKKAAKAAKSKRTLANLPKQTRRALGQQGAAVARRKRKGGTSPRTRAELYEEAKRRNIPGRSKMGRAELARALGRD